MSYLIQNKMHFWQPALTLFLYINKLNYRNDKLCGNITVISIELSFNSFILSRIYLINLLLTEHNGALHHPYNRTYELYLLLEQSRYSASYIWTLTTSLMSSRKSRKSFIFPVVIVRLNFCPIYSLYFTEKKDFSNKIIMNVTVTLTCQHNFSFLTTSNWYWLKQEQYIIG